MVEMDGRGFVERFFVGLRERGMIPPPVDDVEALVRSELPIDRPVALADVVRGFEAMTRHLLSEAHPRCHPVRISTVMRGVRAWTDISVYRVIDQVEIFASCDYHGIPHATDWESDEALTSALACGVGYFFGRVFLREPNDVTPRNAGLFLADEVMKFRSFLAQRRIKELVGRRFQRAHIPVTLLDAIALAIGQTLVFHQKLPTDMELECIVDDAIRTCLGRNDTRN